MRTMYCFRETGGNDTGHAKTQSVSQLKFSDQKSVLDEIDIRDLENGGQFRFIDGTDA